MRDGIIAVKCPCKTARDGGDGVGILPKIDRFQDAFPITGGREEAPHRRQKRVDDIAAALDFCDFCIGETAGKQCPIVRNFRVGPIVFFRSRKCRGDGGFFGFIQESRQDTRIEMPQPTFERSCACVKTEARSTSGIHAENGIFFA